MSVSLFLKNLQRKKFYKPWPEVSCYPKISPIILLLILSAIGLQAAAQKTVDPRRRSVEMTIEAYNDQDFGKMQKPWTFLGRLLVSGKVLRKEFGPYYEQYGRATIDTAYISDYQCVAELKMEKDAGKRTFMKFLFTEKGKIMGMGFTWPPLIYREQHVVASSDPSVLGDKKLKIDSLISKNYLPDSGMRFNGCVLALDKGKMVYKKCYGYADWQNQRLLNDSSRFDLASCSKQFTAVAIMLLEEQGKLDYSDDIRKFIPDLPYENITIEHLLTHTSGLPDYIGLMKTHWDQSKFASNEDIVSLLKTRHPDPYFEPNRRFYYSNTGYTLLSLVIGKASGQSYAEFLEQYIFSPLGMTHTRVYNSRRSKNEKLENFAYGYVWSPASGNYQLPDSVEKYKQVVYLDAITGDGNIVSSLTDLMIWEEALREQKLLKKETWKRAFTEYVPGNGEGSGYGYGFFVRKDEGIEELHYHTGGWPGYFSIFMRFPNQEKTIVVLTNNSYDDFLRLADDMAVILLEQ